MALVSAFVLTDPSAVVLVRHSPGNLAAPTGGNCLALADSRGTVTLSGSAVK